MTSFHTKLSDKIISSDGYRVASDQLFNAYIKKTAGEEYAIDRSVIKNLTTSMQYFYQSEDELVRKEGAELLSMLLYVSAEETQEIVAIADYVFNEAGDFPNISLLQEKFPNIEFKVSAFDEARRDLRKSLNTVEEIDHPLTDYQRSLWEDLMDGEDIITSAPTSTGKTHVILQYLVDEVANSGGAFAAIVVPTRALISEVSSKVYDIAKKESVENDIEIGSVQYSVSRFGCQNCPGASGSGSQPLRMGTLNSARRKGLAFAGAGYSAPFSRKPLSNS